MIRGDCQSCGVSWIHAHNCHSILSKLTLPKPQTSCWNPWTDASKLAAQLKREEKEREERHRIDGVFTIRRRTDK